MAQYLIQNGAVGLTAAPIAVTTGTALKTMLQYKTGTLMPAKIVEWGISFDGSAAAAPGKIELVETGTVNATVTAMALADITKYDAAAIAAGDPTTATTGSIIVGTTGTGYTASAEGTTTVARLFDLQYVAPTSQYVKQFPLGREPLIQVSTITRIRVTFAVAVNCYCYMIIEV